MKIEVTEDELEPIDKALRFYYAYTVSQNREYSVYQTLADRLKSDVQRKPAESERPEPKGKKRTG